MKKLIKSVKRMNKIRVAMVIVAVIIVALLTSWAIGMTQRQQIDNNTYQAVYLTTGQIYFGKLVDANGEFLTLKMPYTQQTIAAEGADSKEQTTLIKVKDQLYGPQDSMAIKSSQVVFWQNLRTDSKVYNLISGN